MATPCFVEGISTQNACQYVVCHVNSGGDWRARAPRRISGGFGGSPARSSARSVVHHMNAMRHLDPDHRCAGALHKCDVFDADQSMDGEISIPSHPAAARRNPRAADGGPGRAGRGVCGMSRIRVACRPAGDMAARRRARRMAARPVGVACRGERAGVWRVREVVREVVRKVARKAARRRREGARPGGPPPRQVWIRRFCREMLIRMPMPIPSVTSAVPP